MNWAAVQSKILELMQIYRGEVLSVRTREVTLLGRKCDPRIMYTFLGFELKAGRKRVTCPDITTARYLKVFAELGMACVKVPYDPTRTARLVPVFESLLERIKTDVAHDEGDPRRRLRLLRAAYTRTRRELLRAGDS
jgi:hypothetical protein